VNAATELTRLLTPGAGIAGGWMLARQDMSPLGFVGTTAGCAAVYLLVLLVQRVCLPLAEAWVTCRVVKMHRRNRVPLPPTRPNSPGDEGS
jgi:hypothetical protein